MTTESETPSLKELMDDLEGSVEVTMAIIAEIRLRVLKKPPARILVRVIPDTAELEEGGDTLQIQVIAVFDDGTTEDITALVGWASTDESVATVGAGGLVTPLAPGDVIIQVLED